MSAANLREARDAKLSSAARSLESVARPGKAARMCESTTLFYAIGGCLAAAGLLGIGDGASKLSVRNEHSDKDECGFKSSEAMDIVQGLLLLVAGVLLVRHGMCIKDLV